MRPPHPGLPCFSARLSGIHARLSIKVNDKFVAKWPPGLTGPPLGGQRINDKHSTISSGLVEAMTSKVTGHVFWETYQKFASFTLHPVIL